MTTASTPELRVLHAVRIRGRAPTSAVAAAVGPGVDAGALLEQAVASGLVQRHDGRAAGWSLTPAGRLRHAALLAEDRAGCRVTDVRDAYDCFLVLNHELVELCTRWQVRPDGAPNDHLDTAYDRSIVAALVAFDDRAQQVCRDAGAAHERMATYAPRLAAALAQVRAGGSEWFTSPAVDSYHTVWFELHEDFLQTLGIPRTTT